MKSVVDLFYDEIVPEAAIAKVKAFFTYATLFETKINGELVKKTPIKDVLVPVLIINNKELFNSLLLTYTKLAYKYYKESYESYISREDDPNFEKNYIKSIMTLLWSNATDEDYQNPISFLKKRIEFFKSIDYPRVEKGTSIGELKVEVVKDTISHETPYALKTMINDNEMPQVEFGIADDTVYIYAIQNYAKTERDKKINRDLYKINEGIDLKNESSDNIEDPGNLKGVTPATVLSGTVALSYFKNMGYSKYSIPSLLITRYNAKQIMNDNKNKPKNISKYLEEKDQIDKIQRNISDKYIRTFRRIEYHFSNIDITNLPYESGTNMIIEVNDDTECNNPLLKEIYEVIDDKQISR